MKTVLSGAVFFLLCGVACFLALLEARTRGHELIVVAAGVGVLLAIGMVALSLRAAYNLRRDAGG